MEAGTAGHRERWEARGRKVSRQVNLAWWLEAMSAPLLISALVGSAALLVARREVKMPDGGFVAALAAGLVVLLGGLCWIRARRKFETPEQALVRIEAAMHLRNGLTAARAGVAPWPAPSAAFHAGLKWQWPRLLVPSLGALALWAAGIFLPVATRGEAASGPREEPQAWSQIDSQLDHLAKEEVVDEKYLEEMQKRIDELRSQKEDQWFSHSSLEATDSLKKAHRAETERMERDLGRAEKALERLEKEGGALSQQERDQLAEEIEDAIEGLRNGAMKPNPKLLEQLKQLDPKAPGKLDAAQREQLRENMKKHAGALREMGAGGEDWTDELLAGDGDGEGEGNGEGEGRGNGGIDRGPGHAPGVLGAEGERLETGALTGLQAEDLSRALPGDLLELQAGEHEVDEAATRITGGGALGKTGSGGDRVWRDSLDPAEQKTLKRFFE